MAPSKGRSQPVSSGWGAPWPSDEDLSADAATAWAIDVGLVDPHPFGDGATDAADEDGAWLLTPTPAHLLGELEHHVRERHRATAAEYRLLRLLLDEAVADPEPWVGPDPTLDIAWTDPRRRTVAAVRRDRRDMAERAVIAEIATRLRLSEQTVRTRAAHAETLQSRCPEVWNAFVDGTISERHAVESARLATSLPDEPESPPTDEPESLPTGPTGADGPAPGPDGATLLPDALLDGTATLADEPALASGEQAPASGGPAPASSEHESWRAFDEGALDRALRLPPARFSVSARALRERVHRESLQTRHRRAARDRGVWLSAELDGMATLTALLPADRAHDALAHVERAARHLRVASDEERTLAQLRADAFADLLTRSPGGAGSRAGTGSIHRAEERPASAGHRTGDDAFFAAPTVAAPTVAELTAPTTVPTAPTAVPIAPAPTAIAPIAAVPTTAIPSAAAPIAAPPPDTSPPTPSAPPDRRASVVITVPALTLLGAGDEPARLDGYGPIDLDTARRLAGEATSWVRILTHPLTGVPLALDRSTYRVPTALRRWLGVTSPTCVFPGCGRPARECDLDHLAAWSAGGVTDDDNLAPECRHHHRIRHETRWNPSRDPDTGDLRWTSPLGAQIAEDPPPF